MGKATLARQKAIGTIGLGRVTRLDDAGLTVLDTAELERIREEIAALRRENKMLREIADDATRTNVVAAQVLKEAMGR